MGAGTLIRRAPHLELLRDPELSVVLLHRTGWTTQDYQAWSQRLLAGRTGFVAPRWEGRTVGRLAFLHPATSLDMVREILDTVA
ncbi:hypothetical protein ADL01_01250 [Streptomyces sp. NRRL WC-3618]|uniref:hypothetical protein n=1 Tax=Streptomyces sp. NRRL WC-3618 TaxID=1519490 RepID=UPI0006B047DE|nr:hypothetical protein [Streptomyces sp. NRRL WC-3618]KOV88556.1 hypothetical protein ADL01_01250 [Streptomyces sp. NRRL WC-3618]